jgi:DNA-binding transcriptional LysR family regulator
MFCWHDLRTFLAVARTGSTLGAGRLLKVSQTTAARRVAALEQALGLVLFERRQAGYTLTTDGEALLDRAIEVERAATTFDDTAAAQSRDARGVVRLTTSELYAVTVLAPILRDLHDAYPAIELELDTTDQIRDLSTGSADVAVRGSKDPQGAGLVGRCIGADPWTLYCSRAYADQHGVPRNRHALQGHAIIGGGGETVWPAYQAWLRANGLDAAVTVRHSSPTGLLSAVRAGAGLAVLPQLIGESDPDLIRCLPPMSEHAINLWVLTHERIRHAPRVRAVADFMYERLKQLTQKVAAAPLESGG